MLSGDLFKAALRKCSGVIAEGETPSSELMENARVAFNTLLDAWSTQRLMVYCSQEQTLTWTANTASMTIGLTGDLTGNRPVRIINQPFCRVSDTDYPLTEINKEQYSLIPDKTTTSELPTYIYINPTVPNSTLYLYPVPSSAIELHLVSMLELTQVSDLVTEIIIPPGYLRALIYNLAVEICPELGIAPSPTVQRTATVSKRSLRAINSPMDIMSIPFFIPQSYDINLG